MIPQRGTLGKVTRRIIFLSGKRITFDTKIIETLHTSLRQSQSIIWRSSKEWHTQTRMDDVDYLVEDNAMDDFSCHQKWMGLMVSPLLKMILDSNCWEGKPMEKLARWGASWEQIANVGNVPTIISAWDSDLVGVRTFQTHQVQKEKMKVCNTNRRDDVARFSGNELR